MISVGLYDIENRLLYLADVLDNLISEKTISIMGDQQAGVEPSLFP
jgi:hypothetical protein